MATNQGQIPILQHMLRPVRQIVMDSIDGITEPKIRQVPARDEWTVVQLMSHITEIEYFGMEEAVLITKESDPDITRSDVENDRRAAAVVDRAGDSLEEHIWSLTTANESAVAATREISHRDLTNLGHRGKNNPITVNGVVSFLATRTPNRS